MDLGHAEHAGDLRIGMAFKKPERENLGRTWIEGRERAPEAISELTLIPSGLGRVFERHAPRLLAGTYRIQRRVDRRPAQIALEVLELMCAVTFQQPQEDRLEHIFR